MGRQGEQASLMSPAELTKALSQRPVALRFVRGDSGAVARDISKSSKLLVSKSKLPETWPNNCGFKELHGSKLTAQPCGLLLAAVNHNSHLAGCVLG